MRPQYGLVFKKMQRKGNDIYIAIDTSKSMLVKDIKPSRFEHAKREIYNLIEELKGDRIGLIGEQETIIKILPETIKRLCFEAALTPRTIITPA